MEHQERSEMFCLSGGSRLYSTTIGSGPDLVLLHPTPLHHGFWIPLASELCVRYRVTLIDFRGHGLSERGSGPITIAQLGHDVECCLDVLGIGQAMFAGCSLGGYVLYEIWRRIPQRVNALAFCCGKPQADSASGRDKRLETIKDVERNGTGPFFDRGLASLSAASFLRRQPDRAAELRKMMNAVSAETVVAIQRCLMERPDSVPTLPTISVPVLALAASEDQASTPEEMRAIASRAPHARFHLVDDAGHFAPFEKPAVVAKTLDQFFSTHQL